MIHKIKDSLCFRLHYYGLFLTGVVFLLGGLFTGWFYYQIDLITRFLRTNFYIKDLFLIKIPELEIFFLL